MAGGGDRQRLEPHLKVQVALLVLVAMLVASAIGLAVLRWLQNAT